MNTKLPPASEAELQRLCEAGRDLKDRGMIKEAEDRFLTAWAQIPSPYKDYDYAQSLSSGLVTFYRDTQQYGKAESWLERVAELYGEDDPYYQFLEGSVFFEAGKLEEAFSVFGELYKKYKSRPFVGDRKKYLEFYL